MGLWYIGGNFQVIDEDEYEAMQQEMMMDDQGAGVGAAEAHASESGGSVVGGNADKHSLLIELQLSRHKRQEESIA
ncbi:hypothetical protein ACET3Z_021156 [Daucus carota]